MDVLPQQGSYPVALANEALAVAGIRFRQRCSAGTSIIHRAQQLHVGATNVSGGTPPKSLIS